MGRKRTHGKHWELLSDDPGPEPAPEPTRSHAEQKIRLRTEKRALGKRVTVVGPLVLTAEERKALAKELKKACGRGGTVTEDAVELQGDCVERAKVWLDGQGWGLA